MGFVENLFKGFIRSTVNQVGRDSGKVISNKIYKDKHATPIRRTISGSNRSVKKDSVYLENEITIPEGFEIKLFSSSWYTYLFLIIGSFILYPISWIYYLYGTYVYLTKKTVSYIGFEKQAIYKKDSRYKTGKKYIGNDFVKTTIEVSASEKELKMNKKKALLYFSVFFIIYVLPVIYVLAFEKK